MRKEVLIMVTLVVVVVDIMTMLVVHYASAG